MSKNKKNKNSNQTKTSSEPAKKSAATDKVKVKKILGGTKFANSKKKIKDPQIIKDKMVVDKNRSLKVKIKHLQKEEKRIEDFIAKNNSIDKKSAEQKAAIKLKMNKLLSLQKKFIVVKPDKAE